MKAALLFILIKQLGVSYEHESNCTRNTTHTLSNRKLSHSWCVVSASFQLQWVSPRRKPSTRISPPPPTVVNAVNVCASLQGPTCCSMRPATHDPILPGRGMKWDGVRHNHIRHPLQADRAPGTLSSLRSARDAREGALPLTSAEDCSNLLFHQTLPYDI